MGNQNPLTTSPTYLHLHLHLHLPTPTYSTPHQRRKQHKEGHTHSTFKHSTPTILHFSFLPFFPGLRPDSRLSPTQHRIRTFQPSTHPPSYFYHSRTHLDSLGRTYIHLLISAVRVRT